MRRNKLVQVLAAGTTLMVPIDPPLGPDDAPVVLTAFGRGSVVTRVVDSRQVAIHNTTTHLVPFLFFIANRPSIAAWHHLASQLLKGL
jgi:hypothetical protein